MVQNDAIDISVYLKNFTFEEDLESYLEGGKITKVESISINDSKIQKYINEYWTSKQRQASSLHEISYRACFKPQLPRFFIKLLTSKNDFVYDPFSGRGTTIIEGALLGRNVISNDINPLSEILARPRLLIPKYHEVKKRLYEIPFDDNNKAEIDISMFYHPSTESELVSIKKYLKNKKLNNEEDNIDKWIRMIATNRLTGHSKGFFSVYTLPPNQAVTPERQRKINKIRNQKPDYRDTRQLILKKFKSLLRNLNENQIENLKKSFKKAIFLSRDARSTPEIENESVDLTVTSPPFLDVVQYSKDNWLRLWFNSIEEKCISKKISVVKTIEKWSSIMRDVFKELFRITKENGWVAFEVGEIRQKKINLEEFIVPIGLKVGFNCKGILINLQNFTKTSRIWGIQNNKFGTNTNRIVIFKKE